MKLLNFSMYILFVYILLVSVIVAQEQVTIKEWQLIENCTGIEELNCTDMLGSNGNSDCYILDANHNLYNFTPNQLIKKCFMSEGHSYSGCLFPIILKEHLYIGVHNDRINGNFNSIYKYDISSGDHLGYYKGTEIHKAYIFLMDKEFYYLSEAPELAHMTLKDREKNYQRDGELGEVIFDKPYSITNAPAAFTSIVGFNNTVYYFSEDGLYYIDISDSNNPVNKKVESVEVTDSTSGLVTDNKNRIWIINADGVIEYNTQKNTADKIANAPTNVVTRSYTRADTFTRVCFYLENKLYYIADNKVSSLDVTSQDDPDNPTKPHEQSGHHLFSCGCMGFEFIIVLFGLFLLKRRH